ncbi:PilN domain-containing protein [Paenibacillus roseipurpureus]|uniref:PilN domain-containing protein n=1 Tax=Paenibacillus roseopurpureus TaxID=2918901 RepID=A0AA96RI47_9BACL|nr:PilN domain-containing protein [Paenibacillus sp. MBLB1832]WNR42380.1 PilN domain-containing protein [Paenibacillus sp. MBLB1832]
MSAAMQKLQSIEINLLQMRQDEQTGTSPLLRYVFIGAFLVIVGGMGWMYMSAKSEIKQTNLALERINQQIKEGQTKLAISPTAGGVADFVALPKQLLASKPQATEVLDKLSALMPNASNITALSFGEGNKLKVTGNFATSEDVITFMQATKASASFTLLSSSGMNKIAAVAEDKNAPVVIDPPLPVIQATFELQYKSDATKKG